MQFVLFFDLTINLLDKLPKKQREEFDFLCAKLKLISARFYIVGGTVRDFFLGKELNSDIDIEVYDVDFDIFSDFAKSIDASGVGKSFFVFKYKSFDISLPRSEIKISSGYKGFSVFLQNDEKTASLRRDFTINSLMYDCNSFEILDFYGGLKDIQTKTLKATNEITFCEDSLRVLRGIRFAGELNFKIFSSTLNLMKSIDLSDLNKERVSKEIEKIANSKFIQKSILLFVATDFFHKFFGLSFTLKNAKSIIRALKFSKKIGLLAPQDELFFYMLKHELGLGTLAEINIFGKFSKTSDKQCGYKNLSDINMLEIATIYGLNNFFGCAKQGIYDTACKFDIFYSKINLPFTYQSIISEGFVGKSISSEFEHRKIIFLENFLNKKS